MHLPPSRLLSLRESFELVMSELGYEFERKKNSPGKQEIKNRLEKAILDGEILILIKENINPFSQDNSKIYKTSFIISILRAMEYHVAVDFPNDKILFSKDGETFVYTDVAVKREQVINWLNSDLPDRKMRDGVAHAHRAREDRRGRRPTYDWDAFYAEITVRADLDGLPDKQADLEQMMLEWCRDTWGNEPAISMIRKKISPIFNHFRKPRPE